MTKLFGNFLRHIVCHTGFRELKEEKKKNQRKSRNDTKKDKTYIIVSESVPQRENRVKFFLPMFIFNIPLLPFQSDFDFYFEYFSYQTVLKLTHSMSHHRRVFTILVYSLNFISCSFSPLNSPPPIVLSLSVFLRHSPFLHSYYQILGKHFQDAVCCENFP